MAARCTGEVEHHQRVPKRVDSIPAWVGGPWWAVCRCCFARTALGRHGMKADGVSCVGAVSAHKSLLSLRLFCASLTLPPAQILHLLRWRECSQIPNAQRSGSIWCTASGSSSRLVPLPPHCWHWLLQVPCGQMLAPPHSLH